MLVQYWLIIFSTIIDAHYWTIIVSMLRNNLTMSRQCWNVAPILYQYNIATWGHCEPSPLRSSRVIMSHKTKRIKHKWEGFYTPVNVIIIIPPILHFNASSPSLIGIAPFQKFPPNPHPNPALV